MRCRDRLGVPFAQKQDAAVAKEPARIVPKVIQHPHLTAQGSSSSGQAATTRKEGTTKTNATSAVTTTRKGVTSGEAAVQNNLRESAVNSSAVASRIVDGRNLSELSALNGKMTAVKSQ